jgi:hypothetical protein
VFDENTNELGEAVEINVGGVRGAVERVETEG